MALAIDASSPTFVALAANTVTTASFTPPVGSLLVVAVLGTSFSGNPNPVLTSTGLTFVSQILSNDAGQGTTQLFTAEVGANGGSSRTVSVTVSGFASVGLKVWVLTGQHATQYLGATSSGTSTSNAVNAGITTDSANNWVLGAGSEFNDLGTPTTTDTNDGTATGLSLSYLAVRKSAATTAAGAETLNMDAAGTAAAAWAWAAIAIRPDTYTPPAIYRVADRGSTQSLTASASNAVGLAAGAAVAVGHYLIARLALDNSGTNGAAVTLTVSDPRSNTWTVVGPGNADPGAADAGSTCYIAYAKVANAYSNGDNVTFNYSPNATAKAIVVEEWHGIDGTTPVAVAATTATGATTAVSIARTPTAAGQLFYAALSVEGPTGDAFTQDTDTVDGTWQTLTRLSTTSGTAASNQTVMGVAKLSSGTTAQTWNPTLGTTRDWAAVALIFAPSGGVTVSPTAISSAEAFGSATVLGPITVSPTGIASAEAFGTASGPINTAPTGIASGEAFGSPTRTILAPFVTSIAGSGVSQYPADQFGAPILIKGDVIWAFPANAGRWNGGDWQADITNYLNTRQSQTFNLLMIGALGSTQNGGPSDTGNTWDSVSPWASGVKGNLNTTYWDRVDYIIDQAAAHGITVLMNVAYSYDMDTAALAGATNTQYTNYGTNLGNRYKTKPNLIWGVGGDYFDTQQTQIGNLFTAITAAGDTHLRSVQNFPESTSRKDISNNATQNTGVSWSSWNFVYSYNVTYDGVDYAFDETSPICTIWGDGHFYQNATADRKVYRDLMWWALSSGARGHIHGSEATWNWASTSAASLTENVAATDLPNFWKAFSAMKGWHKLASDTDSSFVSSASRGTHAAALTSGGGGGQYDSTDPQDQYVTAGVAADGSIAVLYFPVNKTVTVTPSELTTPYNVRWVDPTNGTSTPQAISSTYTPTGTNALGGADWLLVFETASAPTGIASAQAFGTPTVTLGTGGTTTSPTAIASAEAFGTATQTNTLSTAPTGIGSSEAFGAQTATATLTASPTGIASGQAFGTAVASAVLAASPTGILGGEAFGTPAASSVTTTAPTGISTAELFGTAVVVLSLLLGPTGIASSEAFGTSAAAATLTVSPTGIASAQGFGTAAVAGQLTASPSGVASVEAWGTAAATLNTLTASPTGIPSSEAFGSAVVTVAGTSAPVGIPSAEAFGVAAVAMSLAVAPAGIGSLVAFGVPAASLALAASPTGIVSGQALGVPTASLLLVASPTGIPSAQALGIPSAALSLAAAPLGIPSAEAFGAVVITGGSVTPVRDLVLTGSLQARRFGATIAAGRLAGSIMSGRWKGQVE